MFEGVEAFLKVVRYTAHAGQVFFIEELCEGIHLPYITSISREFSWLELRIVPLVQV